MKVLHVVRGLANSSGTTHIVTPLAEAQAELDQEVSVWHVRKGDAAPVEPDPERVESRCFAESVRTRHAGFSRQFAAAVARDLRGFDIVHVHAVWNFPTWWTMRESVRRGIPCMVAPQGSLEPWAFNHGHPVRRWYAKRFEKPLLGRVSRLQALTDTERRQFLDFGLETPAAVIPNGVDPSWLELPRRSLAADLGLEPGTRTLLFLSRLHPKKGLDIALRAFAGVCETRRDIFFAVAGDDAGSGYGGSLRELAASLGLGDRVRFLGEVAGERKRALMSGADAFVLASHSEGLPVAVVEAMAAATPVLITPGCNLPEVAGEGAGMVVDAVAAEVEAGIRALFEEPDRLRAFGERGRELVRRRFTWPTIARRTLAEYRAMIGERAS